MAENYQSIYEGERMDELWTLAGTAVQKAKVNGQTINPVAGLLTLPDYPTELTWNAITGKPSWIGANKPTYTLAELTGDTTHRVVTDAQITAWNGKYTKPSTGIPYADLASGVQTALDKAHEHANKTALDLIRYDAVNNVVYIGDENNPINFAAYGEVSAGGIGSGGGGGVNYLYQLEDVPDYRTSYRGKYLRAKSDGSGTEWVDVTGGVSSVISLTGDITQSQLRTALGLGSAAYTDASAYATATQGSHGETAYNSLGNYVAKAGGTMSGTLVIANSTTSPFIYFKRGTAYSAGIVYYGNNSWKFLNEGWSAEYTIYHSGNLTSSVITSALGTAYVQNADYASVAGRANGLSLNYAAYATPNTTSYKWIRIATLNANASGIVYMTNNYYYNINTPTYIRFSFGKITWFYTDRQEDGINYQKARIASDSNGTYLEVYCNSRLNTISFYAYGTGITLSTVYVESTSTTTLYEVVSNSGANSNAIGGSLTINESLNVLSNITANGNMSCSNLTASGNVTANGSMGIGNSSANPDLYFNTSFGTWYVQCYQNQIAFGKGFAKSVKVDEYGNLVSPMEITAGSDARWKHNITPVVNGIDAIMKLQPSEWEWNSDNHKGSGLIAQQTREVLPHLVKEDSEGYLHLTYDGLHAYEISALQSHETRIERLERENAELKRQLQQLNS